MFEALLSRLAQWRWPQLVPRQRGGHWLRKFVAKALMDFPGEHHVDLLRRLFTAHVCFLV